MVRCARNPARVTVLYIFTVIILVVLLNISLTEANIVVYDERNQSQDTMADMQARFGPAIPDGGIWGHLVYVEPRNACSPVEPPPTKDNRSKGQWIALIRRHGCDFDFKVWQAQQAGYVAALVHNVESDNLVPMGGGKLSDKVLIPSAFMGESDADYLIKWFDKRLDYYIVLNNRVQVNPNFYLIPFVVVVGICFILMLIFMIAKWVRDLSRRRKSRLSKANLKKIPIHKFKKGDKYEVCAICLDDYEEGEKLRVLPCSHAYHQKCIDPWLTKNKKLCPICKRKVMPGADGDSSSDSDSEGDNDSHAPTEATPLLTAEAANQRSRRSGNTFDSTGLPGNVQLDIPVSVSSTSSADSSPASASVYHSSVEVHEPRVHRVSPVQYPNESTLVVTEPMPETTEGDLMQRDLGQLLTNNFSTVANMEELGAVGGDGFNVHHHGEEAGFHSYQELQDVGGIVEDHYKEEDVGSSGQRVGHTEQDHFDSDNLDVKLLPEQKRKWWQFGKKRRTSDEDA